ncbi:MBL fold metallo-hydrolase [Dysgonomonas sp. 25]|uniref:MBL fold metallo-hydrolase n=1 Tax=Dysgonomonas sp. 25 TaxID=2302933 RepID=UPI0013D8A8E6|nr:MBL fold metallo-hydrolase [Dysgonomonas sp. 25]NDV69627.1 MBL fold metallo-hydrolase [Dysgonomonas sp. 25]
METDNKNEVPYEVQSGKVIPADKYLVGEDTLYVTLVGHGSVMLEYKGQIIHIDPYSAVADYSELPKADLILLTHEHRDHLDMEALKLVEKEDALTSLMLSQSCYDILKYGEVLKNGDIASWNGIGIDVVPAYNIKHALPDGKPYHPKGRGNGYVLKFGKPGFVVYIAGDTENIPEMDVLKGKVDIAFLPQNLPYTMDANMFVDAALKVQPKYLYTYHAKEGEMIQSKRIDNNGIEHLIRPMSNKK